jgi:hypothetical protein
VELTNKISLGVGVIHQGKKFLDVKARNVKAVLKEIGSHHMNIVF